MAKTKQRKEQEVQKLVERLKSSKGAVFVSYDSLTVGETTALRQELRAEGVSLTMIKKRLLKIALEQAGITDATVDDHKKNISVAVSETDEVAPAKLLATFAKAHETVELQGGVLESAFIDQAQVTALAKLPSKDELLAKMVGSLKSPLSGMVGVLSGTTRSFVQVLTAIKEQKA